MLSGDSKVYSIDAVFIKTLHPLNALCHLRAWTFKTDWNLDKKLRTRELILWLVLEPIGLAV